MLFRQATIEDLQHMETHSVSRGCNENPETIDLIQSLEHEGELLGIGGLKLLTPASAWTWMSWTERALDFKTFCYRVVKEWQDKIVETFGLKLLMAAVEIDFPEAIATAEHLGYSRGPVLKGFFSDKDAYLYVREIKEGDD